MSELYGPRDTLSPGGPRRASTNNNATPQLQPGTVDVLVRAPRDGNAPPWAAIPELPVVQFTTISVSAVELDTGEQAYTYTLQRTGLATELNVLSQVSWAVSGDVDAFDFLDDILPSGTVTFAPGTTSATLTVYVKGDTTVEVTEEFAIDLSGFANCQPGISTTATGFIINNDTAPGPGGLPDPWLNWDFSDQTDTALVTKSGSNLATVLDQGPNARNGVASGVVGFSTEFNLDGVIPGANTANIQTAATTPAITGEFLLIAVQERTTDTGNRTLLRNDDASWRLELRNGNQVQLNAGSANRRWTIPASVSIDNLFIVSVWRDAMDNYYCEINNQTAEIANNVAAGASDLGGHVLCYGGDTAFAIVSTSLHELAIYEGTVSEAVRQAAVEALATKWTIDLVGAVDLAQYVKTSATLIAAMTPDDLTSYTVDGSNIVNSATITGQGTTGTRQGTGNITRGQLSTDDLWPGKYYFSFAGDASITFPVSPSLSTFEAVWVAAPLPGGSVNRCLMDGNAVTNALVMDYRESGTFATDGEYNNSMSLSRGTVSQIGNKYQAGALGVYSLRVTGTTGQLAFNGRPICEFSALGSNVLDGFRVGNNIAGTQPFTGIIGTVLLYNGLLSDAEHVEVLRQMASDYGIAASSDNTVLFNGGIQDTWRTGPRPSSLTATWYYNPAGGTPPGYDAYYSNFSSLISALESLTYSDYVRVEIDAAGGTTTMPLQSNKNIISYVHVIGINGRPILSGLGQEQTKAPFLVGTSGSATTPTLHGWLKLENLEFRDIFGAAGVNNAAAVRAIEGDVICENVRFLRCDEPVKMSDNTNGYLFINNCYFEDGSEDSGGLVHSIYATCAEVHVTNTTIVKTNQGHHIKSGRRNIYHTRIENCQLLDLEGGRLGRRSQRAIDINIATHVRIRNVLIHVGEYLDSGGVQAPLGATIAVGRTAAERRVPTWTNVHMSKLSWDTADWLHTGSLYCMNVITTRPVLNPTGTFVTLSDSYTGELINNATANTTGEFDGNAAFATSSGNQSVAAQFTDRVNGDFSGPTAGCDGGVEDATAYFPYP